MTFTKESHHVEPVIKRHGWPVWLERLTGCRCKEKPIEGKGISGRAPHFQMAEVGWIKAAAKEANAHDC